MRVGIPSSLFAAFALPLIAWVVADSSERVAPEAGAAAQEDVSKALPEALRALLNEEMRFIDGGMAEIGSALAVGNWETVASIATEIEESFILKQSLTPEQRDLLRSTLPPRFVEMDVAFHGRAAALARAAEASDAEIAVHHLSRLVEGCVSCHAAFAPGRFPGLAKAAESSRSR